MGEGTGAAGPTGGVEEDEAVGRAASKENDGEDDGRRGRLARTVKGSGSEGEDREEDESTGSIPEQVESHREEEEGRRTDEGCQASMSITRTEGQTD